MGNVVVILGVLLVLNGVLSTVFLTRGITLDYKQWSLPAKVLVWTDVCLVLALTGLCLL